MDDLSKLAQYFVEEASALTEEITACFLSFDRTGKEGALNEPMREEAMRALHTLKGSASMMGLGEIVAVAHTLEDTLIFAGGLRRLGAVTLDLLLEGGDLLRTPAGSG